MLNLITNNNRFILILYLMSLTACGTHHQTIISSYAEKKIFFDDVGFKRSSWEIHPLIVINEQVAVKINVSAWESISSPHKYCPSTFSEFIFTFWTRENIEIDFTQFFFTNDQEGKIGIKSVEKYYANGIYINKEIPEKKIKLKKSTTEISVLRDMWLAGDTGNYKKMNSLENLFKVETNSFVGCANDNYQINISFANLDSKKNFKKILYFYPVTYESFSH